MSTASALGRKEEDRRRAQGQVARLQNPGMESLLVRDLVGHGGVDEPSEYDGTGLKARCASLSCFELVVVG